MKLNDFFSTHPVFTVAEIEEFLVKQGSENRWTRKALLAYHCKQGRILPVRRGLYAVVGPDAGRDALPVDRYLLTSRLTPDAVIAYHTALEYHGRSYSVFNRSHYLSIRKSSPLSFRSHDFSCVLFPQKLQRSQQEFFAVVKGERAGLDLQVTTLERTLVDVLDRPDLSGSWEEIWRSLELIEFFDLNTVVEYARLLENATTAAKVGFFLGQHRETLMVEDSHLDQLRELRPRQPHYLERSRREAGHLVAEWNLVVPRIVIERVWEEVI